MTLVRGHDKHAKSLKNGDAWNMFHHVPPGRGQKSIANKAGPDDPQFHGEGLCGLTCNSEKVICDMHVILNH